MPGKTPPFAAELFTFVSQLFTLTSTMGKTWVLPSFKNILIDSCQEYVNTTDKGKEKTRSTLIARVAGEVREVVEGTSDTVPDDLEKVQLH